MHRSTRLLAAGLAAFLPAAQAAAEQGAARSPTAQDPGGQNPAARIEVAFVLDTTGSMADLIDGAKRKIWSIANSIIDVNPDADLHMALVAYRDRDDEYVIRTHDLSTDMQGLYGNLIRLEADGGGDWPESVNEALDEAVRNLGWTPGEDATRIVFLVGDAPPHMDYENAPRYPEVLRRAQRDGITVNAVQAGQDRETTEIWKDIAQRGNGRYIAIPQDGGRITIIVTPVDADIIQLQEKIDATVIPYGSRDDRAELSAKLEEKAMAPASVKVDSSSHYAKKGGAKEVVTGGGDLLADLRRGVRRLEELDAEELPERLRGKSVAEQRAILDEEAAARAALEAQMAELVRKRDAYIAEQRAIETDGVDSFDKVVKKTLRDQIR